MNILKRAFLAFVEDTDKMWESYKRGAMAPIGFLAPLAVTAAFKGLQKIAGGRGKVKSAKEAKRVADVNDLAVYNERLASEANREDARLASVQGIAEALGGSNRALSPEVIAALMKRRQSAVQKRETPDGSKGMGWETVGDIAGQGAEMAGAYMAGSNPNAVSGATRVMGGSTPPSTFDAGPQIPTLPEMQKRWGS